MTFAIHESTSERGVLELEGELDIETAADLRVRGKEALAAGGPLVLDLHRLSFIDSVGLGCLVGLHKAAAGAGVVLRGPQGVVAQLLDITGLDQVFTIEGGSPPA